MLFCLRFYMIMHTRGDLSWNFQEFLGNANEGYTIYHSISPSAYCRYVQIRPVSWADKIALRVELYGYEAGK